MKDYIRTLIILVFTIIVWFLSLKVSEYAKNKEIIKNQEKEAQTTQQVIKKQDVIIKRTQETLKRKNAVINSSSNDDLEWLQNNACSNCGSN